MYFGFQTDRIRTNCEVYNLANRNFNCSPKCIEFRWGIEKKRRILKAIKTFWKYIKIKIASFLKYKCAIFFHMTNVFIFFLYSFLMSLKKSFIIFQGLFWNKSIFLYSIICCNWKFFKIDNFCPITIICKSSLMASFWSKLKKWFILWMYIGNRN